MVASLVGAGLVASAAWQGVGTHRAQQRLAASLDAPGAPRPVLPQRDPRSRPRRPPRPAVPVAGPAREGEALATLRIPAFGTSWRWVVVEGTAEDDLALGPGHYRGTPLFGARGNVAVAAHRAGHGSPFLDFDRLRPGDLVLVTQGGVTWRYRVHRRPWIVDVDDVGVLRPLPGRRLTLTTCWPRYGSSRRMVTVARLAGWTGRAS